MTDAATFKFVFPVAKALERPDGMYIMGYASGPELDLMHESMSPGAIEDFARQIEDAMKNGEPIPFTEKHEKDGVMRELGSVVKGWVDEGFHLGIEVKLDEDNPAAVYLYKSVAKGKKHGMSIHGKVPNGSFTTELDTTAGRVKRTFNKVILDSVGRTTMPVWYPSLGTVLAKAVDEAALETQGANVGDVLKPVDAKAEADNTTETTKPEDAAPGATGAAEPNNMSEEGTAAADEAGVEKAMASFDKVQLAKITQFFSLAKELGLTEQTEAEKVETTEKSMPSQVNSDEIAKAVGEALEGRFAALEAKVTETETLVKSVMENTPDGSRPPVIEREVAASFREEFNKLSPTDKIRASIFAQTGGK